MKLWRNWPLARFSGGSGKEDDESPSPQCSLTSPCFGRDPAPYLKDQETLKSKGPIPLYYEALYGI